MRLVSWNVAGSGEAWEKLEDLNADVALLQEVRSVPEGVKVVAAVEGRATLGWEERPFCTAVIDVSGRHDVTPEPEMTRLGSADEDAAEKVAISRPGTIALATVTLGSAPVILASVYAAWERPVPYEDRMIYADASAHRIISDLAAVAAYQRAQRVIVAGDWNILHGYGEGGNAYWGGRYQTVFDRLEAMGLTFIGPQAPDGGRQADPWPDELPTDSRDVATHRRHRNDPATATRQLDFVFASRSIADSLTVQACNGLEDDWGGSDHCPIIIDVVD